jgi:hypothetical protein
MTRVRSAEAKSIAVPPKATTSPPAVADMKAHSRNVESNPCIQMG